VAKMKISKRYHLRARERKDFAQQLSLVLKINVSQLNKKKTRTEVLELSDGHQIIAINNLPSFIIEDHILYPTLLNSDILSCLPTITVDTGAVPYICNGAHLMAPGITAFTEPFEEGDILVINEERYHKPLAIGQSLLHSQQLKSITTGKVALNLHYVSDPLWLFLNNL
jgi:PUA domain protein